MAQWIGSPNFTSGRGGYGVSGVIVHWMDGNLAGTDVVFQDRSRNTSAHYGVEDGNVHQYVQESDTAYQAGNWVVNEQTIGIEHSAQPGRAPSDGTYENSAQLIAAASRKWGFPVDSAHIHHHYDIISTECSGQVPNGGVDEQRILDRANQILGDASAPVPAPAPAPAPIPSPLSAAGTATVKVPLLYVRAEANSESALAGSQELHNGDSFEFNGIVQGESVAGVSTWLHSTLGHYVWAGGTNYPTTPPLSVPTGGTAEAIRNCNVRALPTTASSLAGSQTLEAGNTFAFSATVIGQNVAQNGVTSNVWYHSTLGHYVWSGNCKTI